MRTTQYRKLACSLLRGEHCPWPHWASATEFIDFAQSQGIIMLLDKHLEFIEKSWPGDILKAVVIATTAGQHLQHNRQAVVTAFLKEFQQNQLDILLFKGASNAYLLYDKPHQRQHADIDILIKVEDYSKVTSVLSAMGFDIESIRPTQFGPYQATAKFNRETKPAVIVDIHWKINNRLLLADTLSFHELQQRSIPVNQYSQTAMGLGYSDALLAACIHEAGSLPLERNRLIGLYDAHLLIHKLGEQEIQTVLELAIKKGIGTICLDYINKAVKIFCNEKHQQMLAELEAAMPAFSNEPSAKLLSPNQSWLGDHWLDVLAINGVSTRFNYIISKLLRKLKFSE